MHARTATAFVFVTLVVLAAARSAYSAPTPALADPASALLQVRPGTHVRLQGKDGRALDGRYVGITDGVVVLDEPPARMSAAVIQKVWIRGRATRPGAIIGGLLLGLSAAAVSAFGAGFGCEVDCEGVVYAASGIGFGIGAGVGALTGGVVGAAFPKWHRLENAAPALSKSHGSPLPGRTGSFSFQGGWAHGRDRNSADGGFGGGVGLSAELGGGWAPGLEVRRFGLGRGTVVSPRGRDLRFAESAFLIGLSVTKTRDHGRLRPYAVAGLGHYSWQGFDSFALNPDLDLTEAQIHRSFFGASLGGGARYRARRNLSLAMEGRWHTSLHNVARPTFDGPAQHWNLVSLTAGVQMLW